MAKKAKPAMKKVAKKVAKKAAPKKLVAKKAAKAAKPVKAAKSSAADSVAKVRVASKPKNTSTLSYTQSEVLENIKGFCGLAKRSQAKELSEDIANFVMDALRKGYKVPLLGLGKIFVRHSKARTGRNPATGEEIQIPAKKRVRFTAAKALKDVVLK
jgi:DNA-binding protein HU-beta